MRKNIVTIEDDSGSLLLPLHTLTIEMQLLLLLGKV